MGRAGFLVVATFVLTGCQIGGGPSPGQAAKLLRGSHVIPSDAVVHCSTAPKDPGLEDNFGRFTCETRTRGGQTGTCDLTLRNARQLVEAPSCYFNGPRRNQPDVSPVNDNRHP
jgi:hypothetical protein